MIIRWSTPEEMEAAMLALMRFCDAVTTDGERFYSCVEEPGHRPPHRKGVLTWTDAAPIPKADPEKERQP